MPVLARDISQTKSAFGAYSTTAGSTVNGAWVDRLQGSPKALPLKGKVIVAWSATLASGETLTLTGNLQDATDSSGTGAAAFGTALGATVVATGPSGGGVVTGTTDLNFDLSPAREFVRSQHKLVVSASGTVGHTSSLVFGGFDKLG